ncbi:MAG TPA: hypothetical protein VEC37_03970, partial [Bacillota bacterium]|nr:hypothetical protein [Bacillota bacterium]
MNTLHKIVVGILFSICIVINWATVALAQNGAGKIVTSVEVQLNISGNIYQGLQERIEYSVNRVGEKLLISQPVSLLENNKETVTQTLMNVFSKALVGFRTESVNLRLGEYTKILIKLTPLPPLITKLDLELEMKKVAPEIAGLTEATVDKVETELNRIFCGLPVEAIAWADNIFNLVINYLVEREFPGFKPVLSIVPGENCRIKLILNPVEPLVSELNLKYSSNTLPTWLVRAKLKAHQSKLNILKGLPVEFLTHYQPQVEQYFTEYLSGFSEIGEAGFLPTVTVTPGVTTDVGLGMSSVNFRTK